LTAKDVAELASPDAIAAFLTRLGYDTADRTPLTPESVGLAGESASAIKKIELLSEDSEQFLRVVFAQPRSLTANPSEMFAFVRDLLRNAHTRWIGKGKDTLRNELLEPLFEKLGFKETANRQRQTAVAPPDYLLKTKEGAPLTAAFVYAWDRWLDGPDLSDTATPDQNPGACVVSALDAGTVDWVIVTNGKLWRLYSRQAHARATNFYEVDLVEALTASGDTDPNEAFRYWWFFLRPAAFQRRIGSSSNPTSWLDDILLGSREYAKRLGDRLKDRIFLTIFPHLAQGFLEDRNKRLDQNKARSEEELADVFEATLTLLYRLLFLLYGESRDLLPIREAAYQAASLKKLKGEVADKAGVAESDVPERLNKAYSAKETALYDRLSTLFRALDKGDPILNVPTYNGGLFRIPPSPSGRGAGGEGERGPAAPAQSSTAQPASPSPPTPLPLGEGNQRRELRIARFLTEHKVPDRYLALAIDRLARDQDERTLALVFIDYKSLEVRHLGSIYEGLLEFKLKVADEDLTTQADKKTEKYIPLSQAKVTRSRRRSPLPPGEGSRVRGSLVVAKGHVYLSNDKAERKASGSYYTPDPIVKYIVAHTVGPVLEEKLAALLPAFRKVRKTFDNEMQKSQAYPSKEVVSQGRESPEVHRQWAGQQTYNVHKDLVENLFDLRVLDPAMGSGHFLVETVDYVTDHLLKFLNQFPINPVNFALVRQPGYIGFITSGSWMKANFGGPLRALLAKRMNLQSVIDFGEWQPFPGAEMIRPSVVVLQRSTSKTKARIFRFLTKGDPPIDLSRAVANSPEIDSASLGADAWRLEGGGLNAIFEKLLAAGVTLGDYTNQQVFRGVTNGLTEAFVIDNKARAEIIRKDQPSSAMIKPYLEGKNLRGWFTEDADLWLIVFPKGVTQSAIGDASMVKAEKWLEATYPGLSEWLCEFKDAAKKRQDVVDYWWELRACEYYGSFVPPKIVWPDISKLPRFSLDYGHYYLGNTGYVIPLEDYYLLGVLASWPTWFMISRICQPLRLRAGRWQYRLIRQFMARLPIPSGVKAPAHDAIAGLARCCNELGPKCYKLECDLLKHIGSELPPAGQKIPLALQHWWECNFDSFKEQIEKLQKSPFVGRSAALWEARFGKEKAARAAIRAQIESAEAELSERVARAFGLSQVEFKTVMDAVSS
jgi:hypothetical protein